MVISKGLMSETTNSTATDATAPAAETSTKKAPFFPPIPDRAKLGRRTLRSIARKRRKIRLAQDTEFAKAYFDAKSKRSASKQKAFKTRHTKAAS